MPRPPHYAVAAAAAAAAAAVCDAAPAPAPAANRSARPRALPGGGIIAAYTDWAACDEKMVETVRDGTNVLIWFAINLECDSGGRPVVTGPLPDLDCVADVARRTRDEGYEVAHLISIGGWNAPHPCTSVSADEWAEAWHAWNVGTVGRPGLPDGFDGVDWDIEGNDDPASPSNLFTVETLDLMGRMFVELKRRHGYLTGMAPAQSYLDPSTPDFSLAANLPPHQAGWHPDFAYHGRNQYAYILAKFGVEAFDLISIQLYEGWSQAAYEVTPPGALPYGGAGRPAAEYLAEVAAAAERGWEVRFAGVGGVATQRVRIPPSRLIVGLANGWATRPANGTSGDGKFLLLWPEEVEAAWASLHRRHRPRGAMFWSVKHEGDTVGGTSRRLVLAKELAPFIRPAPSAGAAAAE